MTIFEGIALTIGFGLGIGAGYCLARATDGFNRQRTNYLLDEIKEDTKSVIKKEMRKQNKK